MKWMAAIVTMLVLAGATFGVPAAAARAFAAEHEGMQAMSCVHGGCPLSAAACAAHCLSAAIGTASVPFVLSVVLLLLLASLPILLSLVPRAPVFRLVPVATGPPGRFERRWLTVMKRE